jgi:hypothetical protein
MIRDVPITGDADRATRVARAKPAVNTWTLRDIGTVRVAGFSDSAMAAASLGSGHD